MNPVALIRLQAELEYGVAIHGETIPVTPANTRAVPRVTVARHGHGYLMLFRADLSQGERRGCRNYGAARLFGPPEAELTMLTIARSGSPTDCCWYCVSRIPDPGEFPDVVEKNGRYVIQRHGQVVSEAWSALSDSRAAEVEVKTAANYQCRGFGRQVVAAWAYHVRRDGKIALYSHLTSNTASRALAQSLGAWMYAETREYRR